MKNKNKNKNEKRILGYMLQLFLMAAMTLSAYIVWLDSTSKVYTALFMAMFIITTGFCMVMMNKFMTLTDKALEGWQNTLDELEKAVGYMQELEEQVQSAKATP